ncbi:MAG: (deoxy)nucleoside triphosphate pyrophosphohydrolase, partial [Myxococcota bacterium]
GFLLTDAHVTGPCHFVGGTMGSRPVVRVVSAEISEDGRYLITQRMPTAVLPLLWEFPGGRVRDGESDAQALSRCVHDRLGVTPTVHELVMEVEHPYDGYDLVLAVYRTRIDQSPRTLRVHALAWAGPDDFERYTFPGADQKTIDALIE